MKLLLFLHKIVIANMEVTTFPADIVFIALTCRELHTTRPVENLPTVVEGFDKSMSRPSENHLRLF